KFGGSAPTSVPNLRKATKHHAVKRHHATTAPKKKVGIARVVIRATRGNSYLAVRAGSSSGRVLYQGTLEKGDAVPFAKPRLWLQITTPTNVRIKLNGNWASVGGSRPRVLVVTAKSIRPAASGT